MKFINSKSMIITLALFAHTNAFSLGSSGWTTVTEISQGQGSRPSVKLANMGDAITGCSRSDALIFRNVDSDVGKRHFSTLLSALASGKEVDIFTDTCSESNPYIEQVKIRN